MRNCMKIMAIIGGILLAVGITLSVSVLASANWDFKRLSTVSYTEQSYTAKGSITSLSVDTKNAPITLSASPDDKVHIYCLERENEHHAITEESGVLTVTWEGEPTIHWFMIDFNHPKIEIQLPAHTYEQITLQSENGVISGELPLTVEDFRVETTNGVIRCAGLNVGELNLKTTNGVITLNDITAENLTAHTQNGAIRLNRTEVTGNTALTSTNALISAEGCRLAGGGSASTTNGAIKLALQGNRADYQIDANTTNGGVHVGSNTGGDIPLRLSTTNGSINVSFE